MDPDLLARRLRGARVLAGLDQADVYDSALAIGLPRGFQREVISRMETTGKADPLKLRALAEIYDVPFEFFTDPDFNPLSRLDRPAPSPAEVEAARARIHREAERVRASQRQSSPEHKKAS